MIIQIGSTILILAGWPLLIFLIFVDKAKLCSSLVNWSPILDMHYYINASVCCLILAAPAAYYKQGALIPTATCAPIGAIFSCVPFSIA